jgi:hypothetical protein
MMTTMLQTNNGRICQESYETASRDGMRRARQLRALGYEVAIGSIGPQVTPVGLVRTTLVTISPGVHADTYGLPEVTKIVWPR